MQDWIGGGRRGAQTEGSIIRGDEVQNSKFNGFRYYENWRGPSVGLWQTGAPARRRRLGCQRKIDKSLKDNPGRRPGDQLKQKDENSMGNGPPSVPKYTSKGQVSDPIARIQDHPAFPFVSSDDFFVAELRALPAYCLALRINLRNLGGYQPFPVECQPSPPCLENEDEAVQRRRRRRRRRRKMRGMLVRM